MSSGGFIPPVTGDIVRVVSQFIAPPSLPSAESKQSLPLSLSPDDITDLRPYLPLDVKLQENQLGGMTEAQYAFFSKVVTQFFDPDNIKVLRLTPIEVGSEHFKIPGNPAVITARTTTPSPSLSSLSFPHLAPNLSISLSPKAFVAAWIYVNGLTDDLWNWENNVIDNAMLYLWLRAFGVDINTIEDSWDWMDGFSKLLGESEQVKFQEKPPTISEEDWSLFGGSGFYSTVVSKPIKLDDVTRNLLTLVYEDIISRGEQDAFYHFADMFADALQRHRIESQFRNDIARLGKYKQEQQSPPSKEEKKSSTLTLTTNPMLAQELYPPVVIGRERDTFFGNPLVMSLHSQLFATLIEQSLDTATYPPLASHLSSKDTLSSFMAVWTYMNAVDRSLGEYLSMNERLLMWYWINYFGIPDQEVAYWLYRIVDTVSSRRGPVKSMNDYTGQKEDEKKFSEIKLDDVERKVFSIIYATLAPRCRRVLEDPEGDDFNVLCRDEVFRRLEIMLGVPPEARIKSLSFEQKRVATEKNKKRYTNALELKLSLMTSDDMKRIASELGVESKEGIMEEFQSTPLQVIKLIGITPVRTEDEDVVVMYENAVLRDLVRRGKVGDIKGIAEGLKIDTTKPYNEVLFDIFARFFTDPTSVIHVLNFSMRELDILRELKDGKYYRRSFSDVVNQLSSTELENILIFVIGAGGNVGTAGELRERLRRLGTLDNVIEGLKYR